MNLYTPIFKQAWFLTWKNKYLWLFGLFISLLGGGIEFEILNNFIVSYKNISYWNQIFKTGVFSSNGFQQFIELFSKSTYTFFGLIFIIPIILIFVSIIFYLSTISQIGVIKNTANLVENNNKNKKIKNCSMGTGIKAGHQYFWKVLVLNLFIKAFVYIVFILISIPVLYTTGIISNIFYFIGFLIFIPLSMIIAFIIKYIIAYVVIKKNTLKEAITEGFELFKNNWLISIEMTLAIFLITITGTSLIIFAATLIFVPFMILAIAGKLIIANWFFVFISMLSIIIPLVIIILGGAILNTFTTVSWTNLFLRLNEKNKAESKVVRVFSK